MKLFTFFKWVKFNIGNFLFQKQTEIISVKYLKLVLNKRLV